MGASDVAERVAASRAAQGLPRHVVDPVVLADVAVLLGARVGPSRTAAEIAPAVRDEEHAA